MAELAEEVGVRCRVRWTPSREICRTAPMAYSTGWRARLAAEASSSTPKEIGGVKADLGYENSEAAFNRRLETRIRRAAGALPAQRRGIRDTRGDTSRGPSRIGRHARLEGHGNVDPRPA